MTAPMPKTEERTNRQGRCKGCSEEHGVQISEDKLAKLVELASRARAVVTDERYANRLSICSSCPGLQYGTTCRYCGCIVHVRAKLADSVCPYPYEPRWN